MKVLRGRHSIKVPVWNSYFCEGVPSFIYEEVKAHKTKYTSSYHKGKKLLEVDKHTLDFMVEQCKKHRIQVIYDGEDKPEPKLRVFEDDPDYKYQEDAAEALYNMQNALLQFGVGSGKTRITLLALQKRYNDNNKLRVLVVTGLSALQQNWLTDSDKFDLCKGRITITGVGNSKDSMEMIRSAGDGQILTANFDMLSNVDLLKAFVDFNPGIVVFDEVHMIANMGNKRVSGAARTEGVHEMQGDHWSLSASPVKFTPFDWRSLLVWLRVLDQEISQSGFEGYYGIFGFNYMGQRVCTEYKNLECMLPLINSVRLAFDGTELPELVVEGVAVDDGDKKSQWNIARYNNCVNQHKLDFVRNLGKRCVVACGITKPFTTWIDALTPAKKVEVFDGTLNQKQRQQILDRCNSRDIDILLLSTTAGGVGLNLATAFSDMVFIDCPNSLVDFWQNYGRVYRIGATKTVHIYKLYCKGTSDEQRWHQIKKDFEALQIFYEF